MNPSAPTSPDQLKAQLEDQLRIITFVHSQKSTLLSANERLITSIESHMDDLVSIFPSAVILAYTATITTQNLQLDWEVENLERDMAKIREVLAQIASPILRAMPMPVMPGPRNIR